MFEKLEENFSEKDITLSPEAREEMSAEELHDDDYIEEDIHEPILADGEVEIGELIKPGNKLEEKPEEKFNEAGFNEKGFDDKGFDEKGFNESGFNSDGKDVDGKPEFNEVGFDEKGFDKDGKTSDGREEKDFTDGFDEKGFNSLGFDKDGKDKDGNTTPKIETPEGEQPESKEDAKLVFQDIVDGKKNVSITDKDGNEINLKDVLTDWSNNENWKKSNTEKSQEHSRNVDAHNETVKVFDENNVAMGETVSKLIEDKDFMENADDFFDGKENNPIRKIFKTVEQSKQSVATRTEQEEKDFKDQAEQTQKTFDDEVALIIADDEKFNDNRELQEIFKLANEKRVSVTTAYELSKITGLRDELKTIKDTHKTEIDEVNDKLEKSQTELKTRNDEVKKLKENPKLIEPEESSEINTGADTEVDDSTADSWESATNRIKDKLGIKR